MTKTRKHILPVILLVAIAAVVQLFTAYGTRPGNWDIEAAQRKAYYAFLRAEGQFGLDSIDAGMRILQRSAHLAPHDLEIATELSLANISLDRLDSAGNIAAYETILANFRANPTDYIAGQNTATMARKLLRFNDLIEIWGTLDKYYPARTDPAVNLANAYLLRYYTTTDTADFDRAIDIFNRLEQGTGKDLGLTSQKVRAYALRHDTLAIERELTELTAAMPADVNAFLLAGSLYNTLQMDSLALANLQTACRVDSTDGRARIELANYYRQTGDSAAYDDQVFRALQSPGLEFDSKYELLRGYVSELYTDSLQWPRIEHLFGVLEEMNPGESRLHALFGAFEGERGNSASQLEQFTYAMDLDPTDDRMRSVVIQLNADADSLDAVREIAHKGTELFPDNFYFPIMESTAYSLRKDWQSAIKVLKAVDITDVKNNKAVSTLLTTLADCYYQADSVEQAFSTYEKAIALNDENFLAYNNYAYFLAESDRDLDKALNYARFAVLNDPENPTSLDTYAWVYFKKKDFAEARKQIDNALRAYGIEVPGDEKEDNKEDEATAEAKEGEAAEHQTNAEREASVDVLSHAGDIYFMNGDPDQAVVFWEKALKLEPDNELLQRKVKHRTYFYK